MAESNVKYEKETILLFNEAEKTADIYTENKALGNKLKKYAKEHKDVELVKTNANAVRAIVPKKWIKVVPPRKMSDEQKQKNAERLKKIREDKK